MDNDDFYKLLFKQLKSAYRKYKTHIYYDNYSQIQRFQLADFEFKNFGSNFNEFDEFSDVVFQRNIDDFFSDFADNLINDFEGMIKKIVDEISVISIPKRFLNENSENQIITNFNTMNKKLNKLHYFIDLPVEGHILGVLWIIRCGYILDDKLYSHCYGNRLNNVFLEKLKKKDFDDFSPFLFKPYYKNYQSWRDKGLNSLNTILKNDKNAIMLSLDFKDYYYRSLIDFKDLKYDLVRTRNSLEQIDDDRLIDFDDKLTDFIELIFNKYSEKFHRDIANQPLPEQNQDTDYKKLPMIPLGFLPSLIISNWNLQGFDKAILEDVHPFYYGRYVDDILIVLESHEKSDSFGKSPIEEMSLNNFLNKYFTPKSENPSNHILSYSENSDTNIRVYNLPILTNVKKDKQKFYHYENLEIQKAKLRIYKFSNKCSDAIIKNFRKNIYKNSSEFRLMHGLTDLKENLEDNLYKISYKESINKLNDINNVKINKYEISKILSRLNFASKNMFNEEISEDTIKEVIGAFQGKFIEFLILWEKLFSFLYINNKFDEINSLIEEIVADIGAIEFYLGFERSNKDNSWSWDDSYKFSLYSKNLDEMYDFDSELELINLKKSLLNFLYSSIIRVVSLKSNRSKINFENFNGELCSFYNNDCDASINKYLFSLMHNNSLMKYPLRDVLNICFSEENYDLIHQTNEFTGDLAKGIYPRFIKFNEFIFHEINNEIFKSEVPVSINYIDSSLKNYGKYNFGKINLQYFSNNLKKHCPINCGDKSNCYYGNYDDFNILNVFSYKKDKIKIGLLNTKLFKENLENRLKNSPDLSYNRFDNIKQLINNSIKKGVELLVMPEVYIPYEWVNEIVRISKDHQMVIIFGVEPILNNNEVGNYIMASLPFLINNKYQESLLVYRLKNHYAPDELNTYKKFHLEPIDFDEKYYFILVWNDIYIVPYYCFEIADIKDRSLFKNWCDIVTVSEFNKDTKYFNNIAESLSRDLFCYCVKSNTSEFGGSVILQPSSSENKYLVNLKGGDDDYIITHNLNIKKLREDAIKNDNYYDNSYFKPKPPGFDAKIIKKRMGINKG